MTRRNARTNFTGIGLLLLAIGGCETPHKPSEPAPPAPPKPAEPPVPPRIDGCRSRSVIAELKSGQTSCAVRGDSARLWKMVPSYVDVADQERAPSTKSDKKAVQPEPEAPWRAAPGADPFCVYEWAADGFPTQKDLEAINGQPECAIALAMAPGGPTREVLVPLAKAFDRQARGIAGDGIDLAHRMLAELKGEAVEVAVVDATPFGVEKPDTSGHGFAVSRVIGSLACEDVDSSRCAEMIRPYLAMRLAPGPTPDTWVDNPNGGYMGTFHQLFRAFRRALTTWDHKHKRIINLSLGWDPIKTAPSDWEVRTMTTLLERAHCEGALVIAAAGNITGSSGPLYPAALETETPPDAEKCRKLMGDLAADLPPRPRPDPRRYDPLVHAVGGVDIRDERLAISRPWGQPRLSAYGMEVTTPAKVAEGFTGPLTGTSMSAAIVSGIAAVVWKARPKLSAAEVVGLVYASGRLLDAKAGNRWTRTEFCLNGPGERCEKWPARRASFCETMNAAMPGAQLKCVDPSQPVPADLFPPVPPEPAGPRIASRPCKLANCGTPAGPMSVQLPENVMPQPGVASCPSCTLKKVYAFGMGATYGTATVVPGGMVSTTVRTYDAYWNPQDFSIPTPTQGTPFFYWLTPPSNTVSAVTNWFYRVGPYYYLDTTSLIVN